MLKNISKHFILGIITVALVTPLFISAQDGCNEGSGEACNDGGTNTTIVIANPFKQDTF